MAKKTLILSPSPILKTIFQVDLG